MSLTKLICLSLLLVPLAGVIVIEPIIALTNPGATKEFLVLITILAIILFRVFKGGGLKPSQFFVHNFFLYATMAFLLFSCSQAPEVNLMYGGGNLGGAWMWAACFWAFMYFFLYLCVMGYEPDENQKKAIALSIRGAAVLSAVYAIIQALGFDQAQYTRNYLLIGDPKAAHITAMIGNPTYLGVWLMMCFPFVVLTRRIWIIALVSLAVILTRSDFALGGLVFFALFALSKSLRLKATRKTRLLTMLLAIVSVIACFGGRISLNGRSIIWKEAIRDITEPVWLFQVHKEMQSNEDKIRAEALNQRTYALTGRGIGSFAYLTKSNHSVERYDHARHRQMRWESAHSEPIEAANSIGIIGAIVVYASIFFVLWKTWLPQDKFYLACYISVTYCTIASFGISVWHIEPLRYFFAVPFILLSCSMRRV